MEAAARIADIFASLLLTYREYQAAILSTKDALDRSIRMQYAQEIDRIRAALIEEGVLDTKSQLCIDELLDLQSRYKMISRMTCGEVFRRLLPATESKLLNAMGKTGNLTIVVETSVLIPMLCTRLFGAISAPYLTASEELLNIISQGRQQMSIPNVFLEECASHLIEAGRHKPLINTNGRHEFAESENGFVSFFIQLNDKN